ncbi:site-specific integrase [Flavobacterium beibuense]|uniref:Tn5520-like integrase n=1 Tax=Flavobacterium beibuense TaxID=657326 RepID=A0A444W6S5_9FLAO|nr:site-specific integrase [Flavobacterium beibuense]RYJ41575.1 Tn5520-like integrase [Flavobacterium beibuense]
MATIKITLKNKPTTEGLYPIVLRIIKDRKVKIISLPFKCLKKDWDEANGELKKSDKNYRVRNRILLQKKEEALKIIDEFELEKVDFTLAQFEKRFRGQKDKNITVRDFILEKIQNFELAGRTGSARTYEGTLNSFFGYIENKQLMFREITPELLEKYENYLRTRGGTDGGIAVRMRDIRTLFNDAIRRGVVKKDAYPFIAYKISKLKGKGIKRALTRDEVLLIENLNVEKHPHLREAKNFFLFSYYTRGMNFYDMMKLKWSNIEGDYIVYTRSKTKGNFKIKILEPVQQILDEYRLENRITGYIFPILLRNDLRPKQIEERKGKKLKKFNKDLKLIAETVGITKKVTSYVARHSFATNLREAGEGADIISQAMGHHDIQMTQTYLKAFEDEDIDKASAKLLREPEPELISA